MLECVERYRLRRTKRILDRAELSAYYQIRLDESVGNPHLPYGLCKAKGIETTGMTPPEAWEALKGEGIEKDKVYSEVGKTGTVKNIAGDKYVKSQTHASIKIDNNRANKINNKKDLDKWVEEAKKQAQTMTAEEKQKFLKDCMDDSEYKEAVNSGNIDTAIMENIDRLAEAHNIRIATNSPFEVPVKCPVNLSKHYIHAEETRQEYIKQYGEKTINRLEEELAKVFEKGEYRRKVNANTIEKLLASGFKNQFETGTSEGTTDAEKRRANSARLTGTNGDLEGKYMEKFGYLGNKDPHIDAVKKSAWSFGDVMVTFDKDKLKDKVTYTWGDSLDLKSNCAGRISNGKVGVEGIAKESTNGVGIKELVNTVKNYGEGYKGDIDLEYYGAPKYGFVELQYHGKLTMNEVKKVTYQSEKMYNQAVKTGVADKLGKLGIEVDYLTQDGIDRAYEEYYE